MPLIVALSILALCAASLVWVDTPFVRYLGVPADQLCSAHQIIRAPSSIDFIALGSSRFRRGIDPDIVAESSQGSMSVAVNFGRGGRDIARSFHILRDLVDRGIVPKYVLLEIDLEAIETDGRKRPMIASNRMAFDKYSDILARSLVFSDEPVFALKLAANSLRSKLHYATIYHLNGTVLNSLAQINKPYKKACRRSGDDRRSKERDADLARQLKRLREKYPNLETAVVETFRLSHSRRARMELHYAQLIRDLSRKNRIKLYITRQWSYMQPHYSQRARQQIKAIIPEFTYPSDDLIDSTMADFPDDAHLGSKGRAIYSQWIGETIARDDQR